MNKVEDFKYLGSYVGSTEKDIDARIGLAWSAFDKLREILTAPKLPIRLRTQVFNASCVSVLLYGCESWTMTEELSTKLDIFTRTIYRIMLGVSQSETHMTNKELYKLVNQHPTSLEIRKRQLSFIGHCLRMSEDEPARIYSLYESKVRESNRQGRRPKSYLDQISKYILQDHKDKLSEAQITNYARDKGSWRRITAVPKKPDR